MRLFASRILPVVGCKSRSVRPQADNVRRMNVVSFVGDLWNNVVEGCKRFVSGSNLHYDQ